MDRRPPAVGLGVFFMIAALIIYNAGLSFVLVRLTVTARIYKEIILLEGIMFTIAYFLRTLDRAGAFWIITGHLLTIIPIYTKFRVVSVIFMTIFTTMYPTFMFYESSVFVMRFIYCYEAYFPGLQYLDFPDALHVLATASHIIHQYVTRFQQKSIEDVLMAVIVLWTVYFVPAIPIPGLVLMMATTILWIIIKSERFPPISSFPQRNVNRLFLF